MGDGSAALSVQTVSIHDQSCTKCKKNSLDLKSEQRLLFDFLRNRWELRSRVSSGSRIQAYTHSSSAPASSPSSSSLSSPRTPPTMLLLPLTMAFHLRCFALRGDFFSSTPLPQVSFLHPSMTHILILRVQFVCSRRFLQFLNWFQFCDLVSFFLASASAV